MSGSVGAGALNLETLARVPATHRSALDPRALSIGIVHLGLGVFHRTHQISFLERAALESGETCWGVSAYSERSPAAAELLAAQDGLYSLRIAAPGATALTVLSSLREARFAPGDPVLIERLCDPAVALVTLTVSEKGYRLDPSQRALARDDPELLADAAGRPPVTVVGQLVRGLEARARLGAPLSVVCCDNLAENGRLLAGLVADFATLPGARVDGGLAAYLESAVGFPSTVVDRISPAPGDADRAAAARALTVADAAAVVTEPFADWVIEDRFAGRRPALERAGARLVDDVVPYAELKLRALNGTHSAIAWCGLLLGDGWVHETLARPPVARFVAALLSEEIGPSLAVPPGVDFASYAASVTERLANPELPYANTQVASDSGQKLPGRILSTVRACRAAGIAPRRCALALACYLRVALSGRSDAGDPVDFPDGARERLSVAAAGAPSSAAAARRALSVREVFAEDLGHDAVFVGLVGDALEAITTHGLAAVLDAE